MKLSVQNKSEIIKNLEVFEDEIFSGSGTAFEELRPIDQFVLRSEVEGEVFDFGCGQVCYDETLADNLIDFEVEGIELNEEDENWLKSLFLRKLKEIREENEEMIKYYEREVSRRNHSDRVFQELKRA